MHVAEPGVGAAAGLWLLHETRSLNDRGSAESKCKINRHADPNAMGPGKASRKATGGDQSMELQDEFQVLEFWGGF